MNETVPLRPGDAGVPDAEDPAERYSCRPDLLIPIYAVISFTEHVYQGCGRNLLGDAPSEAMTEMLFNERHVTEETPPAFLVHRHGFGLGKGDPVCSSWPDLCATWLRQRGWAI